MKTITISTHEITFFDSIKEMPIARYNEMQNYLLQDSGIGNSMADIDAHFKNLDMYLTTGQIKEAISERTNLHISLYAAINRINFKSNAFACFIYKIDGAEIGISEGELKEALKKLKGITVEQINDLLEELKKNCVRN